MGIYGWHDNDLKAFNLEVDGTLTFGDAATDNLIIKGRVSSMTAAGSAIQITSAYAYGEGIEMRYQVTDWTGVGSSFKGMYLRSEAATNSASGKSIYGAEIYGVCNNVTMGSGSLWGAMNYAYVKGVGAVTVNNMYAVQGELTWDASRTGDCTITTAAACFRAKITGGRVADYTKIHGYELTIGEMDGDSQTFGYGIFMQDDSGMAGTSTLTTGVYINIGCTTGISIAGATTDAISISGDATTGLNITSGCTATDGILVAGACADAIHISGSNTTSALHISGDQATAMLVDVDAALATGLSFAVDTGITMTTGIDMTCTGTGTIATAISLTYTADATECFAMTVATSKTVTTGMSMSGAGTYTTGILLDATAITTGISITAGSLTDGIKISGTTPVDGLEISSACSANAINISGVNTANAINISGAQTTGNAIAITSTGTLSGTLKGIAIDYDGVTLGTQDNTGIEVLMHATYGGTGTEYAIYASGDGTTVALCSDAAAAITVGGTVSTGVTIGAATTGMLISGATTEAIDITGNATTAINIDTGAFTSGLTMSAAFSGNAISLTNSALTAGDSYSGVRVAVTAAAATNAYGMAGYFDATITGTTAGHCYGLGSWINTATTPVLSAGHIIVPLECGVYTGEAQANARIVLGQFQAILNGAPATLHVFRVNTTQTTTAIFAAANAGSIGFASGAGTTSTKNGDIPIADVVGTGVVYVRTYDAAG